MNDLESILRERNDLLAEVEKLRAALSSSQERVRQLDEQVDSLKAESPYWSGKPYEQP